MGRIRGLREIVPELLGLLPPKLRRAVILVFLAPVALVVIASAVRMAADILTGEEPPLDIAEELPPFDGDDDPAAVVPTTEELSGLEGDTETIVSDDAP